MFFQELALQHSYCIACAPGRGKGDLCCFANQDVLNVACEYSGQQGPTHAIRPNKVGSWSSFVSKDSMTFDQAWMPFEQLFPG